MNNIIYKCLKLILSHKAWGERRRGGGVSDKSAKNASFVFSCWVHLFFNRCQKSKSCYCHFHFHFLLRGSGRDFSFNFRDIHKLFLKWHVTKNISSLLITLVSQVLKKLGREYFYADRVLCLVIIVFLMFGRSSFTKRLNLKFCLLPIGYNYYLWGFLELERSNHFWTNKISITL